MYPETSPYQNQRRYSRWGVARAVASDISAFFFLPSSFRFHKHLLVVRCLLFLVVLFQINSEVPFQATASDFIAGMAVTHHVLAHLLKILWLTFNWCVTSIVTRCSYQIRAFSMWM